MRFRYYAFYSFDDSDKNKLNLLSDSFLKSIRRRQGVKKYNPKSIKHKEIKYFWEKIGKK